MKNFRKPHLFKQNGGDKRSKVEKHCSQEECQCHTPFVKVHNVGCPFVTRVCSIHGEDENDEKDPCMVISFHPSLRNDNLLHPVQNLLTQNCCPTNKVKTYSNNDPFQNEESLKGQTGTLYKKTMSSDTDHASGYSLKKTGTFVLHKTNTIKKLKKCFHSPCDSVQKSQSYTIIPDNCNDLISDVPKQSQDASTNKVQKSRETYQSTESPEKIEYVIWNGRGDDLFSNKNAKFQLKRDKRLTEKGKFYASVVNTHSTLDKKKLPIMSPLFVYPSIIKNDQKSRKNSNLRQGSSYDLRFDNDCGHSDDMTDNNSINQSSDANQSESDFYITPFIFCPKDSSIDSSDMRSTDVPETKNKAVQTSISYSKQSG